MAPTVTKETEGLDLVPVIFNLQEGQITYIASSFILLGFFSQARLITLSSIDLSGTSVSDLSLSFFIPHKGY